VADQGYTGTLETEMRIAMDEKRLCQQFDFFREIDKEKNIFRQTYLADGKRKENDAEHAWHMSIMTLLLSEYANEKIDRLKTISMLLIHDLVEIDAGDTYAYDEEGKKTQAERERKAADRIFGILPEDQGNDLQKLWCEFEQAKTPEACFAHAMDNIQPMMLNDASDGKAWLEHDVALSQVLDRNRLTPEGSAQLWDYVQENILAPNVKKQRIKNDVSEE
jgi:putative hydrolase of HD superfamily